VANTSGQVTVAFGLLYLFALLGTLPKRPRVSWLLPLVWLAFAFQGIRQGPLFAVVALVAMADMWAETIWHRLLTKYGDSLAREPREATGWRWAAVPAGGILLVALVQFAGMNAPVVGRGWARLDPVAQPVELTEALQDYAINAPRGTRIFNDANLGGFVVYHAPRLQIFMDDRFELYGDDWMRDYVKVVYNEPKRIEDWADRYGFERAVVLVEPERLPLEKYLSESPRWETIVRGDRGAMFRRRPAPPLP
jgi:hypothetical protein